MAAFPLATLLRLRRLREDQTAAEVSRARSHAAELAARRQRLIDHLADTGGPVDAQGVAALAAARGSAAVMLSDLATLRQVQQRVVAEAEVGHADARRAAAAMQKLEDRHGEEQRIGELAREQAALDELGRRSSPGDGATA